MAKSGGCRTSWQDLYMAEDKRAKLIHVRISIEREEKMGKVPDVRISKNKLESQGGGCSKFDHFHMRAIQV